MNLLASTIAMVLTATNAVDPSMLQPLIEALTSVLNPTNVIAILALVLGSGTGLAFIWFGVRKVTAVIMTAFQKGKIRI